MTTDARKAIGKLLMQATCDGMMAVAGRYGLTHGSRIDLSGCRATVNHTGLDLRMFLLDGADLSGSTFANCHGEGVSFRGCILKNVRITAEKGKKASFRGAAFDNATLNNVTLGPRTVDLTSTTFRHAILSNVTFLTGRLDEADFSDAVLDEVLLRGADLNRAVFRNANLRRVSLERASMTGADFTNAKFEGMERWGEPNFEGVTIADELRYAFGVVCDPLQRLTALIERGAGTEEELQVYRTFRDRHREFLSHREVMLIGTEYSDEIEPRLFAKMLKALKNDVIQ